MRRVNVVREVCSFLLFVWLRVSVSLGPTTVTHCSLFVLQRKNCWPILRSAIGPTNFTCRRLCYRVKILSLSLVAAINMQLHWPIDSLRTQNYTIVAINANDCGPTLTYTVVRVCATLDEKKSSDSDCLVILFALRSVRPHAHMHGTTRCAPDLIQPIFSCCLMCTGKVNYLPLNCFRFSIFASSLHLSPFVAFARTKKFVDFVWWPQPQRENSSTVLSMS